MKNIDSVIFDIDGTLWNASEASAEGWTNGFEKLGINRKVLSSEIEAVAGQPYLDCIKIIYNEKPLLNSKNKPLLKPIDNQLSLKSIEAVLDVEEQKSVLNLGGVFYPGVIEGLKKIAEIYPIFIISNCQQWYLDLFLEKSLIGEIFIDTDCNGKSGTGKSEMIQNMVSRNKLDNPVYMGDTQGDYQATKDAGLDFIYAEYGFGEVKQVKKICKDFSQIHTHLANKQ